MHYGTFQITFLLVVVVSDVLCVLSIYLGKLSNLTNIFSWVETTDQFSYLNVPDRKLGSKIRMSGLCHPNISGCFFETNGFCFFIDQFLEIISEGFDMI